MIPRARLGVALVAAGVPLASACGLAIDFGGLDDGAPLLPDGAAEATADATGDDGGTEAADAPAAPDAGDGAAKKDAAPDAPVDGPCPAGQGRELVRINSSFCIDSQEVTVDDYIAFLQDRAGDAGGQPPECSWNTSIVPGGWPQQQGNVPVVGVNWCDAYLYCKWAGKRLCGGPDGGAADPGGWGDPAASDWFNACSRNNDGLHTYPYGNTYDASACNGRDLDAGKPLPSFASCQGGFPGVFDMSGNVLEWEDSCAIGDGGDRAADFCHTRGGSFGEDPGGLRCDEGILFSRGSQAGSVGIRCCAAARR